MKLLPMKAPKRPKGEPLFSLVCGAPAISIGLGAILLLLSRVAYKPAGSERFFEIASVRAEQRNSTGQVVSVTDVNRMLPTMQLHGMLFAGAALAGLGIQLCRSRWPERSVATSVAGLIVCTVAYCSTWILWVVAACT